MTIDQQIDAIVEKYKETTCLEIIRLAMEKLGCEFIIFWGVKGEGRPYEIEFKHEGEKYKTGPYQFINTK